MWRSATAPAGLARIRIEHDDAIAHAAGLQREHPAQLATTHDADRGAGKDHESSGSFRSSDPVGPGRGETRRAARPARDR